jgi:hypothetical protein
MVANERRVYFLESACFNSCAFNSVTVKLTLRPLPSPNETRKAKYKAARAKTGRCGLLLVGQAADHLAKCLMLRSSVALAEKVSELNGLELPAGRLVGTVKNEYVVSFAA